MTMADGAIGLPCGEARRKECESGLGLAWCVVLTPKLQRVECVVGDKSVSERVSAIGANKVDCGLMGVLR